MSTIIPFRPKKPAVKPQFDDLLDIPTERDLEGFLKTLDHLRFLSVDDDLSIDLSDGELFFKIRSFHDYLNKESVESAVKMEESCSGLLYNAEDDIMLGDIVTKDNVQLLISLFKRIANLSNEKENEAE